MPDDTKIELDTTRGPRTAKRDIPEFYHFVTVDELVSGFLNPRTPHLPSYFGKHP